jgi:hypothetical protein
LIYEVRSGRRKPDFRRSTPVGSGLDCVCRQPYLCRLEALGRG